MARLNPNLSYNLTVKSAHHNGRSFGVAPNVKYVFLIVFVDSAGEEYVGEYLSDTPNRQDAFVEGMTQIFKVDKVNPKSDEIIPLFDSAQQEERRVLPEKLKPVKGESYEVALGYAIEVLKSNPCNVVEGSDIDNVLAMADKFDNYLVKKQTDRIIG